MYAYGVCVGHQQRPRTEQFGLLAHTCLPVVGVLAFVGTRQVITCVVLFREVCGRQVALDLTVRPVYVFRAKHDFAEVVFGVGVLNLGIHPVKHVADVFRHVVRHADDVGVTARAIHLFHCVCITLQGAKIRKVFVKGAACFQFGNFTCTAHAVDNAGHRPQRAGVCCGVVVDKVVDAVGSLVGADSHVDVSLGIQSVHVIYVILVARCVHVVQHLRCAVDGVFLPIGVNAERGGNCVHKRRVSVKCKGRSADFFRQHFQDVFKFVQRCGQLEVALQHKVVVEHNRVFDVVA